MTREEYNKNRPRIKCPICKKEFTKANYNKHYKACCNPNSKLNTQKKKKRYITKNKTLNCIFCSKLCKNHNSLVQHELRCKNNPNRKSYNNLDEFHNKIKRKEIIPWNKGLTKETDERIAKQAKHQKEALKKHNPLKGRHLTESHKLAISQSMKKADLSEVGRHSYGKSGWYDNVWLASSYELAYYIYQRDNNINFTRNKKSFKYMFKNNEHLYTPDFYLMDEDIFIEIKGYETEKDLEKYKAVNNLKVLYYNDIKYMIEYVKEKYKVDNICILYDN